MSSMFKVAGSPPAENSASEGKHLEGEGRSLTTADVLQFFGLPADDPGALYGILSDISSIVPLANVDTTQEPLPDNVKEAMKQSEFITGFVYYVADKLRQSYLGEEGTKVAEQLVQSARRRLNKYVEEISAGHRIGSDGESWGFNTSTYGLIKDIERDIPDFPWLSSTNSLTLALPYINEMIAAGSLTNHTLVEVLARVYGVTTDQVKDRLDGVMASLQSNVRKVLKKSFRDSQHLNVLKKIGDTDFKLLQLSDLVTLLDATKEVYMKKVARPREGLFGNVEYIDAWEACIREVIEYSKLERTHQ